MRPPRSLRWRFALAYTALLLGALGALSAYLVWFVRDTYVSDLEERLEHEAALVGDAAAGYLEGELDLPGLRAASARLGELSGARITIIAMDGTVLADTWEDPAAMVNQGGHPEVRRALATGLGRSTRRSPTVDEEMLYAAVQVEVDGAAVAAARAARPVRSNVDRIVASVAVGAVIAALSSVGLAYWLAGLTSRSVRSITHGARRLEEGDLDHRVQARSGDETKELARSFNQMAATLSRLIGDLAGEKDMLSAVLETMADGVVVIDHDRRVVLTNQTAQELLELRSTQTAGARFSDLVRDHELQSAVSRSLESGVLAEADVELLREHRYLRALAVPLSPASGGGALLTLHDLTQVRQVDTTRREFVSNVSHELRNPLASIKAMVEALEGGALEEAERARDYLRRVNSDVDRMTALVNDLLELSRLESGYAQISLSPFDPGPMLAEAVGRFQEEAVARNIRIQSEVPEKLPPVVGEERRLLQVLTNLLENALRATREQGVVTVAARENDGFVEVSVSDTGIGISAEHVAHIFERFYKADLARRDGGTGLGLAIAKHIVQIHGGDISAVSEEGAGSTFVFTVPKAS